MYYHQLKAEMEALPDGTFSRFHWGMHGRAWGLVGGGYLLHMPHPHTALALGICFHEIGHVLCGHLEAPRPDCPLEALRVRFTAETEACEFAIDRLRAYSVQTGPLNRMQQDYLARIKEELRVMETVLCV